MTEEQTEEYWQKDFYPDAEWDVGKDSDVPRFITDCMSGDYTFFGVIRELNSTGEWEEEAKIIDLPIVDKKFIIEEFAKYFPEVEVKESDVNLYYLPHYV